MGENMGEEQNLKQLAKDVSFLKEKIIEIQIDVREINNDLHEIKPEYLKKLKKIDKEGKFTEFSNVNELRKFIESS